MIVSLQETKQHLRVDQDAEDDLIALYIKAAHEYVENYLDSNIPGINDSPEAIPFSIKAAALLLIGGMYQNREDTIPTNLKENSAVQNLLQPFRLNIGV